MNHKPYIDRTYKKFDNVLELYGAKIFKPVATIENVLALETDEHWRLPPADEQMAPIVPGTKWGHEYGNIWVKAKVTTPAELAGKTVAVLPDLNAGEVLCFRDGIPTGMINSKNEFIGGMHSVFFLTTDAVAGQTYEVAFEGYAGHHCLGCFPYDNYAVDDEEHPFGEIVRTYNGLTLCVMDSLIKDFVFDVSTVLQIARLPEGNFMAMKAHKALMAAFPYLIGDVKSATEEEIHESCEAIREILAPALEKKPGGDPTRGEVGVVGHSHMDTAWLWPISETVRKCARTYAEALTLMDMYPEYTFIQSSALHLYWMKTYYPAIFEKIKARVAEGRYDPNGGVWVECDCNITGGEAMVRQFLYGQRFTQKELGYRSDSFWLPDTFGYNGAIPQIMKGSGVKYFYTTKMSWADLNKFPADSFIWRGIDGSEVITHLNRIHMMPTVSGVQEVVSEIRDKHSSDHRLMAYGFGDGGGGPTYGQLEYLKRTTDLPGMPSVRSMTASSFMKELEKEKDQLPLFDGELYLELHRGTLTTMHEVKKNNRQAEIALYEMELMNVLSGKPTVENHDELYHILLQNQFHDILPGTCYTQVYDRTIPEMQKMIADTKAVTNRLAGGFCRAEKGKISLFNPLAFRRHDLTVLDGAKTFEGVVSQIYTDMDGNEKTVVQTEIPALGAVVLTEGAAKHGQNLFAVDGNRLTTPYYQVTFDGNGYITSLVDLRVPGGREICKKRGTPLGTLWFGEDMPVIYDNWEIEDDIFRKLKQVPATEVQEVANGSVEYRLRATFSIGRKSVAVLDTVFYANSPRIDYELKLDWHERHSLVKAGFDLDIRTATVKNEIQFGHVDRPNTRNNCFEAAKYEVCNHKWSDLSETHYGVALLNTSKYGLSCEESDLRLTIQRGGCRPDPKHDFGVHYTTYSLLPHTGAFDAQSVVRPAYELNLPNLIFDGQMKMPEQPLFSLPEDTGIICEAVKKAEDVPDAYVLRLYECERNATHCRIALPGAKEVKLTNLLEEEEAVLPIRDGSVDLTFKPFEIKTLLVR